jgi:hypothetical protein
MNDQCLLRSQKLKELTKGEEERKASALCPQNVQDGMRLALNGPNIVAQGSNWLLNKKRSFRTCLAPAVVLPCCCAPLLLCSLADVLPCCCAPLLLCSPAAVLPCCCAPLLLCFPAAVLPCCCASLLPCCSAPLLLCSPAAVLPCCCAPLLLCSPAAVLPCCCAPLLCHSAASPLTTLLVTACKIRRRRRGCTSGPMPGPEHYG